MPEAVLPAHVTLCIGVGAQRCGTTWLGAYFSRHPSIFMSPIKELHYFDTLWAPDLMENRNEAFLKELRTLLRGLGIDEIRAGGAKWKLAVQTVRRLEMLKGGHASYLEYFAAQVGDCPVAAEITPSYSVLEAAHFEEIRALHPRVRLIFLMRNPVDRVWSLLRHRARRPGFDANLDFDQTIASQGVARRSDYVHTLEALDAAFPAEDVFVEFYENLFAEGTIRRLCHFLEIPYQPAPFDKVVSRSVEKPMTAEQRNRLREILRPVYAYAAERYGERLPAAWKADVV